MAKQKLDYICQECSFTSSKWLGKCPGCNQWETFSQQSALKSYQPATSQKIFKDLDDVHSGDPVQRIPTGFLELDRVLGSGLVPDSFILLGGDPGIGKSTLLLQLAHGLVSQHAHLSILYISAEESCSQIQARAQRLGAKSLGRIKLATLTDFDEAIACIEHQKPQVVIMDSLQTFCIPQIPASPGSVSQVREIANRLMVVAKTQRICIWLVGHVTKEGSIAGPKMVEHMVDTVLYFEGDSAMSYRLLRTVKNRFGSNNELGVFEMTGLGLKEVLNPSSFFLSDRKDPASGVAICAPLEGSRALLVECQALVVESQQGFARRTAVGIDPVRITMLAAILEKHLKFQLSHCDLFFNVAGGLKISDTACDLAVLVALWSSLKNHPISADCVFIGELGLTSEVRKVAHLIARIEEAARLGFKKIIIPHATDQTLTLNAQSKKVQLIGVKSVIHMKELVLTL